VNAASPVGRIELRLRELNQLFDSFDPAPFHEKDLDRDAEEFITSWAREYPPDTPLQSAVQNYFAYRSDLARLDVRRTLQQGRASLLVGLLFLAACMAARGLLHSVGGRDWLRFVEEGLLIIGWVAMWRPVELLLYDWWPLLRRKRTFDNLSRMQVEVLYTE
jgi:hypothetical protein